MEKITMIQQLINVIKKDANLQNGMIIDVPYIQKQFGFDFVVGKDSKVLGFSNQTWGRALAELSKEGLLEPFDTAKNFNGMKTTIHKWRVIGKFESNIRKDNIEKHLDTDKVQYKLPKKLNNFKSKLYKHLIHWKWANITQKPGIRKGKEYDALLPEEFKENLYPIYPKIVPVIKAHQSEYPFKLHLYIGHMASSQAACMNLFVPLLENPNEAARVLKNVKPDMNRIATDHLYKGYRIEFWDDPTNMLKDHNPVSGTDSDIAIAYYDDEENLCLWLIEHKLSEADFTHCGCKESKKEETHDCDSLTKILNNPSLCYYHSVKKYNYWPITTMEPSIFNLEKLPTNSKCPFKKGMNQLWRNQLLARAVEKSDDERWPYKKVYFSVVYHPDNSSLENTLKEYKNLVEDSSKFSYFTSNNIINNIQDESLKPWAQWYKELYYLK